MSKNNEINEILNNISKLKCPFAKDYAFGFCIFFFLLSYAIYLA